VRLPVEVVRPPVQLTDVHFNPAGYAFLGAQVAAALRGALAAPAPGK
jgi:lysophospholipase L1-like esterase